MLIKDLIYGNVEITEPVLVELISSKALDRIKKVSQYGLPDKFYYKKNYSRFDHCLGVMILLRNLGASVEEQIAGLLHDVSHSSFSHIADWVFGEGAKGNENYQDEQHENFVKRTEIPEILEKYGFDLDRILDEKNFSLLENKIPDICADRIDYALRELAMEGDVEKAKKIYKSLENYQGKIIFQNYEDAFLFAEEFLELHLTAWGYEDAVVRCDLFSRAFKMAIDAGLIHTQDFWEEDEETLISKLENSDDKEILELLKRLESKDFKSKRGEIVHRKFRYVDPFFLKDGRMTRLIEVNSGFKEKIAKEMKENEKGVLV
jgi:HD superfamily phosphohydrolase